jgi:hypothetical protein
LAGEVSLPPWEVIFWRRWVGEPPPSTDGEAFRLAITKTAHLDQPGRALLRSLLASYSRVPSDVAAKVFTTNRRLAELLLEVDGDDRLRLGVIRLLDMM